MSRDTLAVGVMDAAPCDRGPPPRSTSSVIRTGEEAEQIQTRPRPTRTAASALTAIASTRRPSCCSLPVRCEAKAVHPMHPKIQELLKKKPVRVGTRSGVPRVPSCLSVQRR